MAARDKAAGASLPADPHHPAPDGSTPVQDGTETGTEAGVAAEISTRPDDAVPGVQIDGQGLPPAADTPSYVVVSPVRHDGTHYAVDAPIELSAADAARLLALGAIRER